MQLNLQKRSQPSSYPLPPSKLAREKIPCWNVELMVPHPPTSHGTAMVVALPQTDTQSKVVMNLRHSAFHLLVALVLTIQVKENDLKYWAERIEWRV